MISPRASGPPAAGRGRTRELLLEPERMSTRFGHYLRWRSDRLSSTGQRIEASASRLAEPPVALTRDRLEEFLYPVQPRSRKSLGEIIRKLSVTESQSSAHLLGTSSRRKTRVASANSPRVW